MAGTQWFFSSLLLLMPGDSEQRLDYEREAYALRHSMERRLLSDEPLAELLERHRELDAERWRQTFMVLAMECKDHM